jgi:DNA-directed RNA polymerase specialized sigma24 family protein
MAAVIERMRPADRALLALLFVEHLTPVEAAEALGRSVRGVEKSIRALSAEMRSSLSTLRSPRRKVAESRSRKAA